MLKVHSVFLCLMVIMFNRDHAALLSIQLITVCQVFAVLEIEHRNELVSRGDSVVFTCNMSATDVTQIIWTKGRFYYAFLFPMNKTISNFTSLRLRIDNNLPSKMNISNVQHDDAGSYRCCLIDERGTWTIEWDLKVSGEPEKAGPLRYPLYILTAVIGFLLCVVTAVCLCRKLRARPPTQSQFHLHSVEVTSAAPQGATDSGTNKRRSQYKERLNSIYGL